MHYLGIFVSYKYKDPEKKTTLRVPVISISTMASVTVIERDDCDDDSYDGEEEDNMEIGEATTFTAQATADQISNITKSFFGFNSTDDIVKCICSDSAAVCRAVAKVLGKPLVNCFSHLWALQMVDVTKEHVGRGAGRKLNSNYDREITDVTEESRRISKHFRKGAICGAVLRKQTELNLKVPGKTRWSGNFQCTERLNNVFDNVWSAHDTDSCPQIEGGLPNRFQFKVKLERTVSKLESMNAVTKKLQINNLPLNQARNIIDTALESFATLDR